MTGADLVEELCAGARKRGVPLNQFIAPLSPLPARFIKQLRFARAPKPATVERVLALIEDRPVPPPPPNNFQDGTGGGAYAVAAAGRVAGNSDAQAAIERRRAIAEAAAAERLPGETLHDAVRRLERRLEA